MKLTNDDYDAALEVFERAVIAFCRGDLEEGDRVLSKLDLIAIERDRAQLQELAKTASRVESRRVLYFSPERSQRRRKRLCDRGIVTIAASLVGD